MIVTKETLDAMALCGNQWAKLAYKFVGEQREITYGNVVVALERGVDLSFFADYWMRQDCGKRVPMANTGAIAEQLLWIYDRLLDDLGRIGKGMYYTTQGFGRQSHLDLACRAEVYLNTFQAMWYNRRWAI